MAGPFRNFEKPDGWTPGEPEVLVSSSTVRSLGMPRVDYGSLHELLTDKIKIPYDEQTRITLFGRTKYSGFAGVHPPLMPSAIFIHAPAAEYHTKGSGGVVGAVVHEAQHRSDFVHRKLLMAGDLGARVAATYGMYELGEYIPASIGFSNEGIVLAGMALVATQLIDPVELNARKREKEIVGTPHELDILFPDSPRTELLRREGRIPEQILGELGLAASE